jgi:hypothetical protein
MKILSKLVSTRKDLDGLHTLRRYGRPLSVQKNIAQVEEIGLRAEITSPTYTPDDTPLYRKFTYFKTTTTRPCRVVLKAPFHYKKGKHRLTLFQRKLTLQYQEPTPFTQAHTLEEFLVEWEKLFHQAPIPSTQIAPNKSTTLEFPLALCAKFFLI